MYVIDVPIEHVSPSGLLAGLEIYVTFTLVPAAK